MEIEFRAMNMFGDWVFGSLVIEYENQERYWIYGKDYIKHIVNKKETVGQYIGLKDKNGTKIYVGDIVEYKGSYGVVKFGIDGTDIGFHVHWDDENEDLGKFIKRKDILFWIQRRELPVIGNIHENKELLENGK